MPSPNFLTSDFSTSAFIAGVLSAFVGFYSETIYHPEFGSQQMCVWPDDAMHGERGEA